MNQYQLNKEIEEFIQAKDKAGESYSEEDTRYIQQYEGAGGQGKHGAKGQGVLYEFFTPNYICELMVKQTLAHGYDGGNILEPSIATGRLIKPFQDKSKVTAFEINSTSARIAQITYPEIQLYNDYFETAFLEAPRFTSRLPKNELTWLKGYPFSLVIGNPPYGKYKNRYSVYFKNPKIHQIEMFFMYYGLKLLKPGGLLLYITSSNFLRNGITYNSDKEEIGKIAELLDAYRLPPVFKFSQVPTDILIFKRKLR